MLSSRFHLCGLNAEAGDWRYIWYENGVNRSNYGNSFGLLAGRALSLSQSVFRPTAQGTQNLTNSTEKSN